MKTRTGMTQTIAWALAHEVDDVMTTTNTHHTEHGEYDVEAHRVGTQGDAYHLWVVVIFRDYPRDHKHLSRDNYGPRRGVIAEFNSVKDWKEWKSLNGITLLKEGKLDLLC
jgi:hypothetical protein